MRSDEEWAHQRRKATIAAPTETQRFNVSSSSSYPSRLGYTVIYEANYCMSRLAAAPTRLPLAWWGAAGRSVGPVEFCGA